MTRSGFEHVNFNPSNSQKREADAQFIGHPVWSTAAISRCLPTVSPGCWTVGSVTAGHSYSLLSLRGLDPSGSTSHSSTSHTGQVPADMLHVYSHQHTHTNTLTHSLTSVTHTNTLIYTNSYTQSLTHTHIYIYTHVLTRLHSHTDDIHTHTHSHTLTHTESLTYWPSVPGD